MCPCWNLAIRPTAICRGAVSKGFLDGLGATRDEGSRPKINSRGVAYRNPVQYTTCFDIPWNFHRPLTGIVQLLSVPLAFPLNAEGKSHRCPRRDHLEFIRKPPGCLPGHLTLEGRQFRPPGAELAIHRAQRRDTRCHARRGHGIFTLLQDDGALVVVGLVVEIIRKTMTDCLCLGDVISLRRNTAVSC